MNNHGVSVKEFASICLLLSLSTTPALAENIERIVDGELSDLVTAYNEIHAHPELSHQEQECWTAGHSSAHGRSIDCRPPKSRDITWRADHE